MRKLISAVLTVVRLVGIAAGSVPANAYSLDPDDHYFGGGTNYILCVNT